MTEKYLWLAGKIKKGEIVMEGQRKTRLLLADDSITIRKVVEMTMPQDRFQITSVGDGEAALEALGNERPDVLLADVIMPKMDGYELCSVLRSSPEFKDIPVILLVGTFENYDEVRGREAGADDHIVKPFETNDLIDKIRAVIATRGRETEARMETPFVAAEDMTAALSAETVMQETAASQEMPLEYGDQVEFTVREAVELEEGGAAEGVLESFETLADVPSQEEFLAEETTPAEPETTAHNMELDALFHDSVPAVVEEVPQEVAVAGDENFPWEEEMDLPEEEPVAAAVDALTAVEEPVASEEHVFSLADFRPDVLEALEKGYEIEETVPDVPIVPAAESLETVESVEEAVQIEEAVETEEPVPAVQEAPAAETAEAARLSPAEIPADSLQALQETIEQSVHKAVLNAFGDIFREAVEKAAREVVPGLVEKAIREELERQRQ